MMLLISGFIAILTVTFGVVMLAAGPSRQDKRVEQRLAMIQAVTARLDGTDGAPSLLRQTSSGGFAWLEASFEKYSVWKNLQKFVMQSGVKSTASGVVTQSAALAVIGLLIALIALPILIAEIGAACVLGSLPWIRIAWMRSRKVLAFNAESAGGDRYDGARTAGRTRNVRRNRNGRQLRASGSGAGIR